MSDVPEKLPIVCSQCDCTFSAKKNLYRHIRKFHPSEKEALPVLAVTCIICGEGCQSLSDLQIHILLSHPNRKMKFCSLVFYCIEDFFTWKQKIERTTNSMFVKKRADRLMSSGITVCHYFCHRSGKYVCKADRKRKLKHIGLNKIGMTCPAHIVSHIHKHKEAMEIHVTYQSTHVGHKCENERMPLKYRTTNPWKREKMVV